MIAGLGSGVPRGLIQGDRLPEQLFCLSDITRRLPDQPEIVPENRFGASVCCPLKQIQRLLITPARLFSPSLLIFCRSQRCKTSDQEVRLSGLLRQGNGLTMKMDRLAPGPATKRNRPKIVQGTDEPSHIVKALSQPASLFIGLPGTCGVTPDHPTISLQAQGLDLNA